MSGLSKNLKVSYFAQPTAITCQSTALKMMANYLEQKVVLQSTGAADKAIPDIWKDINEDPKRPSIARNAHANMKWWLQRYFPSLHVQYVQTDKEDRAIEAIVGFIDSGFPVLVSVSHARVAGHIILVTGYENYERGVSSGSFELIVHDPYGRFDPSLLSSLFGVHRWTGGASLMTGGEMGPGAGNHIPITAAGRQRTGDAQAGTYYLLSASR